ncbi:ATP-binding protein [Oceanirhabdus seepicola]|nr:ATP-binding protein [Oceanirhabdus seepicola]
MKRTLYSCSKCRDTSWLLIDGKARRCGCYEIKRLKRIWEKSGISLEQKEMTFKSFNAYSKEIKNAKDTATKYYINYKVIKDSRNNSIVFLGQVGSGKTHLSIALAINFINKEIPVIYMPYRDVIMNIKQNILDSIYYRKTIERYQKAEILLIDDLYKGKITESDINILFEIINYRYLNNKAIIVSSERSIDEILRIDEGIGSRIYEMCKGYLVEIRGKGNNYRVRG